MRPLTHKETNKRGCMYCLDRKKARMEVDYQKYKTMQVCIHDVCPYHELDQYDTYADYLKNHKPQNVERLIDAVFNKRGGSEIL